MAETKTSEDRDAGAVELCVRLRPRLVGTLSLFCGDAEVAEELAQETLVRVWSHWPSLREMEQAAVTAWAYRVALNLAGSWVRRRIAERRAVARLQTRLQRPEPGVDLAEAIAIRRQVAMLPARQRTALILRYYADLPVEQVAGMMGCAPGTVKALTSKAIAKLRGVATTGRHAAESSPVRKEVADGGDRT